MRDELRTALDALVGALRAHAQAATDGTRPDVPDPLPQATTDLLEAVAAYTDEVERSTGAYVPWAVPELPVEGAAAADAGEVPDVDGADEVPDFDGEDWAGGAERWR